MEADTVTITDNEGNSILAGVVGSDYESGFGLVRTAFPPRIKPIRFGDSDSLELRSEAARMRLLCSMLTDAIKRLSLADIAEVRASSNGHVWYG